MRQLFTPVITGVFFCAADNGKGDINAGSRTLSQRSALRLALRFVGQVCPNHNAAALPRVISPRKVCYAPDEAIRCRTTQSARSTRSSLPASGLSIRRRTGS